MDKNIVEETIECPTEEIGLYLDGELPAGEASVLERHLLSCESCRCHLNRQKEMLLTLDFAFDEDTEFELPKNFTKIVVANAESEVKGLRSKQERLDAMFLCAGLALLVTIGLGAENETFLIYLSEFASRFAAIFGFVLHLVSDITTGTVIILRSLSQQVVYSPVFFFTLFACGLTIIGLTLARFSGRLKRF